MVENYKPNSHKYKEEASKENKEVTKVVKGTAKLKKKNELQKVAGSIISEDAKSVKSYILMDVLVPAIKDAIEDIVTNGIRMLLRGDTSARRSSSGGVSHISYNKAYDNRDRRYSSRPRGVVDFDDLILDTRGEAEDILRYLDELIEKYGIVSVGDMYDAAGIRDFHYTANKYGWTNIRNAEVVRVSNGYWLKMPKVCPID